MFWHLTSLIVFLIAVKAVYDELIENGFDAIRTPAIILVLVICELLIGHLSALYFLS